MLTRFNSQLKISQDVQADGMLDLMDFEDSDDECEEDEYINEDHECHDSNCDVCHKLYEREKICDDAECDNNNCDSCKTFNPSLYGLTFPVKMVH